MIRDLNARMVDLLGDHLETPPPEDKAAARDPQRIRPGKSEVLKLWASNEKAQRLLGWSPRVSLDEGLRQTETWLREIGMIN